MTVVRAFLNVYFILIHSFLNLITMYSKLRFNNLKNKPLNCPFVISITISYGRSTNTRDKQKYLEREQKHNP